MNKKQKELERAQAISSEIEFTEAADSHTASLAERESRDPSDAAERFHKLIAIGSGTPCSG